MAIEDIDKKDLVRTLLKDVVIKSLGKTLSLMKLEVSDDNISRLHSYQGTIKRKLGAVKTIEKELIDLYYWFATCARKPKVHGSSPAASYVQR